MSGPMPPADGMRCTISSRNKPGREQRTGTKKKSSVFRCILGAIVDDTAFAIGAYPPEDRPDTHPDPSLFRCADNLPGSFRPLIELDDSQDIRGHLFELLAGTPDNR